MADLNIKDTAAITRIAARLAPMVTNSFIDGLARELRFPSSSASNKARKIQLLLGDLLSDGRTRATASKAIVALAMEAHHRAMTSLAEMTVDDVDALVVDMRVLDIPTGDLGRANWRSGLKRGTSTEKADGARELPSPEPRQTPRSTTPRSNRVDTTTHLAT